MEFLRTPTQYTNFGYPIVFFYVIALIGLFLIVYRPYWAFLFALFCLAARNFHSAVFTRTPIFGPYLNLNDLLLWISLFAMMLEVLKKGKIYTPKILLAILGLLIIGDLQAIIKFGFTEEVLRRIWQFAIFPILFLVSTNIVTNIERAKSFFLVLFCGGIIASLQHIYYIISVASYGLSSGLEIRTISYIMSGGLYLIIALIFSKLRIRLRVFKINFYYLGMALIIFSYIMSLTRSMYVAVLCVFITMPFLLPKGSTRGAIYRTAIVTTFVLLLIQMFFQNLDVFGIINERLKSFMYSETFQESYKTRFVGQQTEIDLWLNSSIIFGLGSSLPPKVVYSPVEEFGALYHVGYSTYLAHFGIAGFIIYAILLPFLTVKIAKKYYTEHIFDYGGMVAIMGISISLFSFFTLPTSYHYLGATSHIDGLIYGAIWGLHRGNLLKSKRKLNYSVIKINNRNIGAVNYVR